MVIFAKHNYKDTHIAKVGDCWIFQYCWIFNPTLGLYVNNYVLQTVVQG